MFNVMSQEAAGQDADMQQTESTQVRVAPQSALTAHICPAARPVHCPVERLHFMPLAQ
jgi:hypothetical protein